MFDAKILYFAYDNSEGDDFGVGYLSNKEEWIARINKWGCNNKERQDYTVDDFEDLDEAALCGVLLAEVEPIEKEHLVTWSTEDEDFSLKIDKKGEYSWENNSGKNTTVPRWVSRLKRTLKEYKNQ